MHAYGMSTSIDVRALRQRVGWKQDRLARYLGVDRSSVSHMENGRAVKGPIARLLQNLASAADHGTAENLCPDAPGDAA